MIKFSFWRTGARITSATMAGTKVSDKRKAAANAKITVNAMGRNIFPSTPVRARIGK